MEKKIKIDLRAYSSSNIDKKVNRVGSERGWDLKKIQNYKKQLQKRYKEFQTRIALASELINAEDRKEFKNCWTKTYINGQKKIEEIETLKIVGASNEAQEKILKDYENFLNDFEKIYREDALIDLNQYNNSKWIITWDMSIKTFLNDCLLGWQFGKQNLKEQKPVMFCSAVFKFWKYFNNSEMFIKLYNYYFKNSDDLLVKAFGSKELFDIEYNNEFSGIFSNDYILESIRRGVDISDIYTEEEHEILKRSYRKEWSEINPFEGGAFQVVQQLERIKREGKIIYKVEI